MQARVQKQKTSGLSITLKLPEGLAFALIHRSQRNCRTIEQEAIYLLTQNFCCDARIDEVTQVFDKRKRNRLLTQEAKRRKGEKAKKGNKAKQKSV